MVHHFRRCGGSQKGAYRLPESRCREQCGAYGRHHSPLQRHALRTHGHTRLKLWRAACAWGKTAWSRPARMTGLAYGLHLYQYQVCFLGFGMIADLRRSDRSPKIARTSSQTEPKTKIQNTSKYETRRVTSHHIPLLYRPAARFSSGCCRCPLCPCLCPKQSVYSSSSSSSSLPATVGASKSRPQ